MAGAQGRHGKGEPGIHAKQGFAPASDPPRMAGQYTPQGRKF